MIVRPSLTINRMIISRVTGSPMESTIVESSVLPSDSDGAPTALADIQTHCATLDSLLALLHDSGDPETIRLCNDLGVPVDGARRGSVSVGDAARRARALAATLGSTGG